MPYCSPLLSAIQNQLSVFIQNNITWFRFSLRTTHQKLTATNNKWLPFWALRPISKKIEDQIGKMFISLPTNLSHLFVRSYLISHDSLALFTIDGWISGDVVYLIVSTVSHLLLQSLAPGHKLKRLPIVWFQVLWESKERERKRENCQDKHKDGGKRWWA